MSTLLVTNNSGHGITRVSGTPVGEGEPFEQRGIIDIDGVGELEITPGVYDVEVMLIVDHPGSLGENILPGPYAERVSIGEYDLTDPELDVTAIVEPFDGDDLSETAVRVPDPRPACTEYFDDDNDGEWDRIVHYRHDELATEYDDDADGQIDRITKTLVDESTGAWAGLSYDTDADGTPDRIERIEDGTILYDDDNDGEVDRIERTFELDDAEIVRVEMDSDADGDPDRITETEVKRAERQEIERVDEDADGAWDRITTVEHLENEKVTRIDSDGDGTVDRIERLFSRVWGWEERLEIDEDADGTVDATEEYERVRWRGAILTATTRDEDNDGEPDWIERIDYDAAANVRRVLTDSDGDGNYDAVRLLSRECFEGYDEEGPIL